MHPTSMKHSFDLSSHWKFPLSECSVYPTANFLCRKGPTLATTAVVFPVDLINQGLCSVHVLSKPLGKLSLRYFHEGTSFLSWAHPSHGSSFLALWRGFPILQSHTFLFIQWFPLESFSSTDRHGLLPPSSPPRKVMVSQSQKPHSSPPLTALCVCDLEHGCHA